MKTYQKIISIFIILILFIQIICPIVFAKDYTYYTNYLALGDSIAKGYGLEGEDQSEYSYAQRVKGHLSPKVTFNNKAVTGMTCKTFSEEIKKNELTKLISNADLITISIGSNELLSVLISSLSQTIVIEPDTSDPQNLLNVSKEYFKKNPLALIAFAKKISSEETATALKQGIQDYKKYWEDSISYIRSKNSKATIIATEFYNPYFEFNILTESLDTSFNEYIDQMNEILYALNTNSHPYEIATIREALEVSSPRQTNVSINQQVLTGLFANNTNLINFNNSTIPINLNLNSTANALTNENILNLDPHPNATGHETIANKILEVLSTVDVKKTETTGNNATGNNTTGNNTTGNNTTGNNTTGNNTTGNNTTGNNTTGNNTTGNNTTGNNTTGNNTTGNSTTPKKDIRKLTISSIEDYTYTGSPITPKIVIKDNGTTLQEGVDYSFVCSPNNPVNDGQVTVTITGMNNYEGSVTKTFNIIKPQTKERTDISTLEFKPLDDLTYLGWAITPDIEIYNNSKQLILHTDYELSYTNNIDVTNEAQILVSGIGNYKGSKKLTFKILPKDISYVKISDIATQTYAGSPVTPEPLIIDGSHQLIKNKDYKISYSNNEKVGIGTINITGLGNYNGSTTKTFEITNNTETNTRKDIANLNFSDIKDIVYTGKSRTPSLSIYDDDKLLIKDTDYTLSYTNNLNVGIAHVTITGIGNYAGSAQKDFNILQKNVDSIQIHDIYNQKYTGNEIKPTILITSDSIILKENEDYTIEYKNNKDIGTASVIIKGINNYTGTTVKTFNIISDSKLNDDEDYTSYKDNQIKNDSTVSNNILPFTGLKYILFIFTLTITIVGIYSFIKYNKNKDIN